MGKESVSGIGGTALRKTTPHGAVKVLDVRPVGRVWPAEHARHSVLPGVARDIEDGLDPRRFEAVQTADETSLNSSLPAMGDAVSQPLRALEIESRELEARKVRTLVSYVEDFKSTRQWDRRAAGIDGRDVVTAVDNQGEMWRYWTEERQAHTDEDAGIMYAAQALGWSEYRTARLYDNAVTSRDDLPKLWDWFCQARVSVLAMGKVAQAARKLTQQKSLAKLDAQAPAAAAQLRPTELDQWLKRFLAELEPEQHAMRFAEAARQRYVSVRPAEDHDGMSILTSLLPTVTAQAIAGKLRAMARSHMQPVAHNPVIVEPPGPRSDAWEPSPDVPEEAVAAGFTVSEEDWLRDQVEEAFAGMHNELPATAPELPPQAPPKAYVDGDQRSLAQREADLLCSWLLSAEHTEELAIDAQIGLLVPIETLAEGSPAPGTTCDRSDAVPAEVLRQLIGDPANRIRWHSMSIAAALSGRTMDEFDVLAHTYSGYQAPAILRQALRFRDGVCQAPGCAVAADRGDIDHVVPWPEGATRADNLEVLCRRHHRIKTAGHRFTIAPD